MIINCPASIMDWAALSDDVGAGVSYGVDKCKRGMFVGVDVGVSVASGIKNSTGVAKDMSVGCSGRMAISYSCVGTYKGGRIPAEINPAIARPVTPTPMSNPVPRYFMSERILISIVAGFL